MPLFDAPGGDGRYKVVVEINCRIKRAADLRNIVITGRAVALRDIAAQITRGSLSIIEGVCDATVIV